MLGKDWMPGMANEGSWNVCLLRKEKGIVSPFIFFVADGSWQTST